MSEENAMDALDEVIAHMRDEHSMEAQEPVTLQQALKEHQDIHGIFEFGHRH